MKKLPKIQVAICQIRVIPGRPDLNVKYMLREIKKAKKKGMDMIIFPEMCVSGYMIGDMWENNDFLTDLMYYNEVLLKSSKDIIVIWGNAYVDFRKRNEDGRARKYNAAFVAQNGKWAEGGIDSNCGIHGKGPKGVTFKSLLAEYRIFFDERYFHSLRQLAQDRGSCASSYISPFGLEIKGEIVRVGVSICEDAWDGDYKINPTTILRKAGADLLINISCSPWTWKKDVKRHQVMSAIAKKNDVPVIYVNNVGTQNNGDNMCVFKGRSTVYNSDGRIHAEFLSCKEGTGYVEIGSSDECYRLSANERLSDTEELYEAIIYGIQGFFRGLPKDAPAVVGSSGGIDSAVVATLLAEAIGPNRVISVNMPTEFNSSLTKNAARKLAKNLGIQYLVMPIQDSYMMKVHQLEKAGIPVSDFNRENIQARERGAGYLAAIAAAKGGVFINTSNKTEAAFNYGTLYGDWNGAFAPIADCLKGEVYQLANYINMKAGRELIPKKIIDLKPSAELSANQDITKGQGDPFCYPYHDKLVRAFLEFRMGPSEILQMYVNGGPEEVERRLLVPAGTIAQAFPTAKEFVQDLRQKWVAFCTAFKRVQSPTILIVSKRAFGQDFMEFISESGAYFAQMFLRLEKMIMRRKR